MARTAVEVVEENGKWRITGTTYIDNDENRPWPVDFECETENEAMEWVRNHGWELKKKG